VVKNEGSGYLEGERIEASKLVLEFPDDFTIEDHSETFSCNKSKCVNVDSIELFMRESPALIFKLKAPTISEPYKTFKILASASYTYELRGSIEVAVQPLG